MNDPALRKVCEPVKPEELGYIKSLVPEMTKIMLEANGAALAANQVGVIKRFFIMKDAMLPEGQVRFAVMAWVISGNLSSMIF